MAFRLCAPACVELDDIYAEMPKDKSRISNFSLYEVSSALSVSSPKDILFGRNDILALLYEFSSANLVSSWKEILFGRTDMLPVSLRRFSQEYYLFLALV